MADPTITTEKKVIVEFIQTKKLGKWTWRLKAKNGVDWAGPDENKGFFSQANAKRSFWAMVTALGGDPNLIEVRVIARKGYPDVYDGRTDTK